MVKKRKNLCVYGMLQTLTVALTLMIATTSFAKNIWSGCLKVNGISDYQTYDKSIKIHTTTNTGTCTNKTFQFRIVNGVFGHTQDTMKTSLSLLLSAQTSGKGVMFWHNNLGPQCAVQIVALGGYDGRCE